MRALVVSFLVVICAAISNPWVSAQEEAGLQVGAAVVDITPPNGTPMAGYYSFRAVEGVLDPIFAKAIVVEQDATQVAIVVVDLAVTNRSIVTEARKRIQVQCGILPERVMISATHTHSGPQLPRGSLMDELTRVNSPAGVAYIKSLPDLIAKSVLQAQARLAPAQASVAIGQAEGISFNRRVLRKGSNEVIWQPKKINPAIETPAGPVDTELGLLVFHSAKNTEVPLAALLNFAMHPTSVGSGEKISADYPGVLTRLISERHGADMIGVFANGCCGNINHSNYVKGTRPTTKELGMALADAADAAWSQRQPLTTFAPRTRSAMVTLPRRQFTPAEIDKAKNIASRMLTEKLGTVPMAEAVCVLETMEKQDVPLEVEVQAIAISEDLAIVALPGEIFVELGLAIKADSPFKNTFIAELANGSMGYVPHREAYAQGNYEVVSARAPWVRRKARRNGPGAIE